MTNDDGKVVEGPCFKPGWITSWGAGGVMTSPAGPLGRLRSCSAPLLAALSHYYVCLGKISNVKPLQHPEHAAKGDAMEKTAGERNRD